LVRSRAAVKSEHYLQGLSLRTREGIAPVENRSTELMKGSERELHLGLDTDRSQDAKVLG
jgi:hypothetical protein